MGVEDFWSKFPADSTLRPQMERIKTFKASTRSLMWLFARELYNEAGEGLREVTRGIDPSGFSPGEDFTHHLDEAGQNKYRDNFSAALYGLTVVTTEDCLVYGEFDSQTLVDRFNLIISGTPVMQATINGKSVEEVKPDQFEMMIRVVKKDQTLADIFTPVGLWSLPDPMIEVLERSCLLDHMRTKIDPEYRKRAVLLTAG